MSVIVRDRPGASREAEGAALRLLVGARQEDSWEFRAISQAELEALL
jgi:hypothetical protein